MRCCLGQAVRAGISGAERMLAQLAQQGGVSRALTMPHAQLGTLARAIDTAAGAAALAIVASAGRVEWIAHAYGATLAWTLLLKVAVLVRLRRPREESPFRVPFNLGAWRAPRWPIGLWAIGAAVAATWLAMVVSGDAPTIGASVALARRRRRLRAHQRAALPTAPPDEADTFRLLPSHRACRSKKSSAARRRARRRAQPHSLSHVSHAIDAAGDRDIVVMTARLLGVDAEYEDPRDPRPTPNERVLFSNIVAMAEHHGRTVRLLIVPSYNVFDAVVEAVLRLQASDVFVGESTTLSAEAQARLLGEAWERSATPDLHGVRLVIHHRSGRTDIYPPRRSRSGALLRRSRSHPPPVARRRQVGRAARASSRRGAGGVDANGTATERTRTRGRPAGDPDGGAAGRRAGRDCPDARLLEAARHDPQPAAGAPGEPARRAERRGSGRGVPPAAAQGRRGDVRVPVARTSRKRC